MWTFIADKMTIGRSLLEQVLTKTREMSENLFFGISGFEEGSNRIEVGEVRADKPNGKKNYQLFTQPKGPTESDNWRVWVHLRS